MHDIVMCYALNSHYFGWADWFFGIKGNYFFQVLYFNKFNAIGFFQILVVLREPSRNLSKIFITLCWDNSETDFIFMGACCSSVTTFASWFVRKTIMSHYNWVLLLWIECFDMVCSLDYCLSSQYTGWAPGCPWVF